MTILYDHIILTGMSDLVGLSFVQTSKRQRTDKDAEIKALRLEIQGLKEENMELKASLDLA